MPPAIRFDFDFETDFDWVAFKGHVLDAKANIAALAIHGPGGGVGAGGAGGRAAVVGGALSCPEAGAPVDRSSREDRWLVVGVRSEACLVREDFPVQADLRAGDPY